LVRARLSEAEIAVAWRSIGVSLSPRALEVFGERRWVDLQECGACGFQHFHPVLPGNGAFYSELQSQLPNYYRPTCTAFERTIGFARQRGLQRVLDVGCGAGAFLDLAREAGLHTHGLELNAQAAAVVAGKGHQVHTCRMNDFGESAKGESFDLVTAFEVVEHVPDPVKFLSEAARLVRPNGYLAISVPNRGGVHRLCPWEPHEWPPHHLTRWRIEDLKRLAVACGLEVVGANREILLGSQLAMYLSLHSQIAAALGKRAWLRGEFWPRVIGQLYSKTGCRYFLPPLGAGSYAFYYRPSAVKPAARGT
jgi:SAM-dependent methyltransferase